MDFSNQAKEVAALVQQARRVLVITGAGISAESGIPTFRGAAAAFPDGKTEEGLFFEDVLSRRSFNSNPALTWKYFGLLEQAMRGKHPNAGHLAIAGMQAGGRFVCVATQNIDGLHQAAGSQCVLELHGDLRRLICTACEHCRTVESFEGLGTPPSCPDCGELLRPDVVLYGEQLPQEPVERYYQEQAKGFDMVFSIGTTSIFPYVIEPIVTASRAGVPVVEVNPEPTMVSGFAKFKFTHPAGQVMQKILQAMSPELA